MSHLWPYQIRRPPIDIDERPILDQNRNRIITYNRDLAPIFRTSADRDDSTFGYMRERGYELIGEIGRGGYGVVYKARSIEDVSKMYAIKINFDVVARSTVYLEVAFFHLMRKKGNLPQIADFFYHNNTPHIVLQYFQHQQFIQIFEQAKTLKQVKHYLIEMLKGLNILKNLGIKHRDIKPLNFLYNIQKKKGIIIDFGLAEVDSDYVDHIKKNYQEMKKKVMQADRESNAVLTRKKQENNLYRKLLKANKDHGFNKIGTQSYVPLQTMFHGDQQSYQCQIWSVGVIFLQFLTQKLHFFNQPKLTADQNSDVKYACIFAMELAHLFGAQPVQQQLRKCGWRVNFPKGMPQKANIRRMIRLKSQDEADNQNAYDLLMKMIHIKPESRISADQAIWHPFFDEIREEHFVTPSQLKWYTRQKQKRSKKEMQQEQDANFPKSISMLPAESSFSKSLTKPKKQEQMINEKQSDSDSEQQKNIEIKTEKQKKKTQNQSQKQNESEDIDRKVSDSQQEQQKADEESRINIQSAGPTRKKQQNMMANEKKQKIEQKQERIVIQQKIDIMETIRKYVATKEIDKVHKFESRDRININNYEEKPKPKQVKVVRKPLKQNQPKRRRGSRKQNQSKSQKRKERNEEQRQAKQVKQVRQAQREGEKVKEKEDIKVDSKFEQLLRQQQQKIKKQSITELKLSGLPMRKLPLKKGKEISEDSDYVDDQD